MSSDGHGDHNEDVVENVVVKDEETMDVQDVERDGK
jgi:hypothetical protein